MTDADAPSDLDAIIAAIARLRGRSRPPFGPGEGPFAGHRHGGPHHGPHAHGHARHDDDDERSWMRGGPHGGRGDWAVGGPRFGGGPARLRLLEALAAASHPLSVGEVGEAIGVDQPRASRLIQQAVEFGLVRREADPDDARRTRVALTEQGARLARGFRGERRERMQTALEGFTPDERAELARLLVKLAEAWPQA